MPIGRRKSGKVLPVPYLTEKDAFANQWVAVKDDRVIAAAPSSRELVYEMRKLGDRAKGAVAEYVRAPSDSYIVGAG